jgi:hypothetical protein
MNMRWSFSLMFNVWYNKLDIMHDIKEKCNLYRFKVICWKIIQVVDFAEEISTLAKHLW